MLEPLDGHILVTPEPLKPQSSIIAVVGGPEPLGRECVVLRGSEEFEPGERVIVSMRQAIQVGDDLLVPLGAILARLEA